MQRKIQCAVLLLLINVQIVTPLHAKKPNSKPTTMVLDNKQVASISKLIEVGLLGFILASLLTSIATRLISSFISRQPRDPEDTQNLSPEEKKKKAENIIKAFEDTLSPIQKPEDLRPKKIIGSQPKDIKRIIKQIEEPEKSKRLGCSIPKAIVLCGPPGTGKTEMAKAIVKHLDGYMFTLSGPDLQDERVGRSAKIIAAIFQNARKLKTYSDAPIFILLDELDGAFQCPNSVKQSILNKLTSELSENETKNYDIRIIATTNNAEELPDRITRGGRFEIIQLQLPRENDRMEIFENYAQKYPINPQVNQTEFQNELKEETIGFSGADIEQTLKNAALEAFDNDQEEITPENIREAIKKTHIKKEIEIAKSKFAPEKTNLALGDLYGSKTSELELLIKQFQEPEKFTRLGSSISKTVLLCGSPGTGKTTLVKAIANQLNANFFQVSGADLRDKFVGQGKDNVNLLFNNARTMARNTGRPSVVLLDEFDGAISGIISRTESQSGEILTKLKFEITDDNEKNENLYIFATTNHPENFPEALTRAGRFRIIEIPLPESPDRAEIFKKYLEKYVVDDSAKENLFVHEVGEATPQFSGADIKQVLENASHQAAFNNQEIITKENINHALENHQEYVKKQKEKIFKSKKVTKEKNLLNTINSMLSLEEQKEAPVKKLMRANITG